MAALENQVLQVTNLLEKQIDTAIEQIDNLDVNDLEQIRKARMEELKKLEDKKREWLSNGHGKYEELAEEKMFFDIIKKSDNVVIHFFTGSSPRCEIVDKHLKILAPKHIETLFTKLNAEKCPFLAEKLRIKTIPSIVLIQNSVMIDKIVGFTQLGNRDDFTTDVMEWRIAQNNVINYEGDLSTPPDQQQKKSTKSTSGGRKIRDGYYNRDDYDLDIEEEAIARDNLKSEQGFKIKSEHLSTELTEEEAAELGLDD
ncbi:thioredoxin domain-containing protein 9-like [Aethina tumida]|uniref:thioredoxin domain-containing protein 9-like n=1 Tax=Aethina tumida TaxID=116153 RepID=UPI0021471F98|nr:thioredoxin domain-containing protein 9-like [Aethina tumida]